MLKISASNFVREIEPDGNHIGIRAAVDIVIPVRGTRRIRDNSTTFGDGFTVTQRISSPGIWGVESDCDDSRIADLWQQECAILSSMLTAIKLAV